MSVIVVANDKGGVGKTTLSLNLAWLSAQSGRETLLVDCNEAVRSHGLFALDGTASSLTLATEAQPIQDNEKLTFVDLGPNSVLSSADWVQVCRLLVLVTTPDPASILGAVKTARRARAIRPDVRFGVVVTRASSKGHARSTGYRVCATIARLLSADVWNLGAVIECSRVTDCSCRRLVLSREYPGHASAKTFGTILSSAMSALGQNESSLVLLPSFKEAPKAA
ncbi:MAG: ParA family protein [Armatimonadetes bacterium]|nr:ParA family protein [Armatimonadota bacterium]